MASAKPPGFLQVDVDGLWAVRACYGRPERESFVDDPCWTEGVPRLRRLFEGAAIPASFFIVGRDVESPAKRVALEQLIAAGFEIGNHSYSHRLGLTLEPMGFINQELKRTDELLRKAGAQPAGFRAPGYDIDARIVRAVRRLGHLYDASLLPTYAAPLLRLADAWMAQQWNREKKQFGRFSYGRAPRKPYFPRVHALRKPAAPGVNTGVLEIPVGVTPVWRFPLTASSLFPLSRRQCRRMFERLARKGRPVLLLLHAIDAVDCRQPIVFDHRRPRLGGFSMSYAKKEKRLQRIVADFARSFQVRLAADYAAEQHREGC